MPNMERISHEKKIHFKILFFIGLFFITLTGNTFAFDFNIDFGTSSTSTIPSNSYGAASGQAGIWFTPDLGTTPDLTDINGLSTPVDLTLTAATNTGNNMVCTGDMGSLINDNFYTCGGTWLIAMSELPDGVYDVYLYAPTNVAVATGNMVINGITVNSIPGSLLCNMSEGVDYTYIQATVSGGSLSISGDSLSSSYDCAGLSGLQLTLLSKPEPIPTLSQWSIIIFSLILAGSAILMINRKKTMA